MALFLPLPRLFLSLAEAAVGGLPSSQRPSWVLAECLVCPRDSASQVGVTPTMASRVKLAINRHTLLSRNQHPSGRLRMTVQAGARI